jgi:hypothetical protein
MNDPEFDAFEAELRAISPAAPPQELVEKLMAARSSVKVPAAPVQEPEPGLGTGLHALWRWLIPATAVAALAVAGTVLLVRAPVKPAPGLAVSEPAPQETIEIDRQLLLAYDTVAELASGEPVRFHCREWEETVTVRDPVRGIAIERRTPRLEVTPVRLETY